MQPDFPENLLIQTTSHCNSGCMFCPYRDVKYELSQGIMEEWVYKKIIDECSRHSNVKRIMPYFMNEPLCDTGIVEKINYAKENNPIPTVHILTNGIQLEEPLSSRLITSKLDWIGISIHAIREQTYKRFTGRTDFKKIIKNITHFIKKALSLRDDNFIMINITHPPGYLIEEEKDEAIEYWRSLGVKRIEYFQSPISRAGNVEWLPQVRHHRIKGCNSIWRNEMIHILYNGEVVLCCMDWRREVILGNVKEQSIEEIWNSALYREIEQMIRGQIPSPPDFLCKRCEMAMTENT